MSGDDPMIDWSGGAPRSTRFGDIYFSPDDGLAESRAVFLQGCGLPEAWRRRDRFVVGELGFGTGLNIAALLELWRRKREPGQRLHVFSVEAYPLPREDAAGALGAFSEIAEVSAVLLGGWPGRARGFHRVDLPWDATLDLAVMDATEAMAAWSGRADAWFLDGFAPSANSDMWTQELLSLVAARSAPGARAATFTVANGVRRGLEVAGFRVEKQPGHGRKKHRLEAVLLHRSQEYGAGGAPCGSPEGGAGRRRPTVAIVGAGIGGAAVARALAAEGLRPVVIEAAQPGAGASGNPSALVAPRLDAGGGAAAGLHAQAFSRAVDLYGAVSGAALREGVMQLETTERDGDRFDRLGASDLFEPGDLTRLAPEMASMKLGETSRVGALWLRTALTVDPAPILEAWLSPAYMVAAEIADLEYAGGLWRLLDAAGQVIAETDVVCLCAGHLTVALADLDLRPVRGQVSFAPDVILECAAAWGGYLAPAPGGMLFGATHDRSDVGVDVRDDDHQRNLAALAKARPDLAERASRLPLQGRAGVRAVTRDHLPLAGEIAPGLFVLTGLGGRGFTLAPLLAEHLAATIVGAPSPLPRRLADAVDPKRVTARSRRPLSRVDATTV